MTPLTQSAALAIAPALIGALQPRDAVDDPAAAFTAWRLAPEQIVGAYSLVARRSSRAAWRRPQLGHSGPGLFFPK